MLLLEPCILNKAGASFETFFMSDQQAHEWMKKARQFLHLDKIPPWPRKIIVSLVGGLIFIAGIVMIVTPGPAFVLIPLGLLLLASEFKWAKTAAQKILDGFRRLRDKWRKKRPSH